MAIIDTTKHDESDAESISSSTVLVNEQLTASVTSVTSTTSFVVVDGEDTAATAAAAAAAPTPTAEGRDTSGEEATGQAPLTIPLDAATPVKRVTVDGVLGDNSGVAGSRGLMRRDSLKRRESLLKGKEGSRRRQRWENDHFTHNPHYIAPEPRDFAPEPVHPKRIVRYEFASLWDPSNPKMFGYNPTTASSAASSGKQKSVGTVTKNLRDRVKRSEWAVGLLRDLEEEVRRYAAGLFGCSASSVSRCSSVTPDDKNDKEKEKKKQKRGGKRKLKTRHGGTGRSSRSGSISSSSSSIVVVSDTEGGVGLGNDEEGDGAEQEVEVAVVEDSVKDSEDEEIVFVPKMARMSLEDAAVTTTSPPPQEKDGAVTTEEEVEHVQLEKPMFEAPASDPSASFVRWLIHSIALYYGLRSWSVDVGSNPQMRVAFVGVNPSISSSRKALAKMRKNEHLPRPLWRML